MSAASIQRALRKLKEPVNADDHVHVHRRWWIHLVTLFKQLAANQFTSQTAADCGKMQISTIKGMIEINRSTLTQEQVRNCVSLDGESIPASRARRGVHGGDPEGLPRAVH